MPAATGGTTTAASQKNFVLVKLGTAQVKVTRTVSGTKTKKTITRPILCWVRETTQTGLNFKLADPATDLATTGDDAAKFSGTIHGKTLYVPNPVKGDKPKTYCFQVPGWATRNDLAKGFAETKVKQFRFAGGRRQWGGK